MTYTRIKNLEKNIILIIYIIAALRVLDNPAYRGILGLQVVDIRVGDQWLLLVMGPVATVVPTVDPVGLWPPHWWHFERQSQLMFPHPTHTQSLSLNTPAG